MTRGARAVARGVVLYAQLGGGDDDAQISVILIVVVFQDDAIRVTGNLQGLRRAQRATRPTIRHPLLGAKTVIFEKNEGGNHFMFLEYPVKFSRKLTYRLVLSIDAQC